MSDDKRYIDYYFCLNSPWVYLAQKRLEEAETFDRERWFTRSRENLCRQYDIYLVCAICS